jgi:plastocyanin
VRRLALCVPLAALLLAGCSSSGSGGAPAATSASAGAQGPDTIVIQNFAFHPNSLSVAPGASVTVVNRDSATHTVTSTANPKAFDTGDVAPGTSVTFRAPTRAGSYAYICTIHQYMQGLLTVE